MLTLTHIATIFVTVAKNLTIMWEIGQLETPAPEAVGHRSKFTAITHPKQKGWVTKMNSL